MFRCDRVSSCTYVLGPGGELLIFQLNLPNLCSDRSGPVMPKGAGSNADTSFRGELSPQGLPKNNQAPEFGLHFW